MNAPTFEAPAPELLKAPAWQPTDGKVKYHYSRMPIGSRCLWTAAWTVNFDASQDPRRPGKQSHVVTLRNWEQNGWELSKMPDLFLQCELEDLTVNPSYSTRAVQLLYNTFDDHSHWRYLVEEILFQARPGYRQYTAPWNPPATVEQKVLRPGWEVWEGIAQPKIRGIFLGGKHANHPARRPI